MKQLDLEKAWYKYFKCVLYPNAKALYQKKCRDWEYFINCIVYEDNIYNSTETKYDNYNFEVQFTHNDKSINIQTVQWFNDVEEKSRPYPTIKEVEEMIDKMYLYYITNL